MPEACTVDMSLNLETRDKMPSKKKQGVAAYTRNTAEKDHKPFTGQHRNTGSERASPPGVHLQDYCPLGLRRK